MRLHNFCSGPWLLRLINGSTRFHTSSDTSSLPFPASINTHRTPSPPRSLNSSPIRWNTLRTRSCISSVSYLSCPNPPRSLAISGVISKKITKSGAGNPTSGLLHQSNGRRAWPAAVTFEAENAMPENAYRSQMTVVPEVNSVSILVL